MCSWALLPFTKMGSPEGGAGWKRNDEMGSDVEVLLGWLEEGSGGVAEAKSSG